MGYYPEKPASDYGDGWKSLKEIIQEYLRYCNDYGETPKNRKALTDMLKKEGYTARKRRDGMWFYLPSKNPDEELSNDILGEKKDDGLPF